MSMSKSLDPAADMQFNNQHPRAAGATGYYRPGQFVPKSQAEKQQEEAEEEVPDTSGDPETPPEETTVATGTSDQDAEVATEKKHAKQLKKAAETEALPRHTVTFGSRADATKFAIAADHLLGRDAALRVGAAANGKYVVQPDGLSQEEIDALQEMIHTRTPLPEITLESVHELIVSRKKKPEPQETKEEEKPAEPVDEGQDTTLTKGGSRMDRNRMLLVPVKRTTEDSTDNDGKALPLGSHERITDTVGSEEKITEPTAKYPKTGKKAKRRPRLILKG